MYATDNSGARLLKCIDVLNKKKTLGFIGDTLLVSVKKAIHRRKLKKKLLYFGLIVSTKSYSLRADGTIIKFSSNRVLIFSKTFKFLGTRIYGGVAKDIRVKLDSGSLDKKKFQKVSSYMSLTV